jgi:hypothetical protein
VVCVTNDVPSAPLAADRVAPLLPSGRLADLVAAGFPRSRDREGLLADPDGRLPSKNPTSGSPVRRGRRWLLPRSHPDFARALERRRGSPFVGEGAGTAAA